MQGTATSEVKRGTAPEAVDLARPRSAAVFPPQVAA